MLVSVLFFIVVMFSHIKIVIDEVLWLGWCHLLLDNRPLVKSVVPKIKFSYFSTKTYVVGAQKNRLNETVLVLLSTQNIC